MNRHQLRITMLFSILLVAGACAIFASTDSAEARVVTVGRTGANYTMIQEALYFAQDGDTILIQEGSYFENIVINRSITIQGEGSEKTKIDSLGNGHVVVISADSVNFSGIKVTGAGPEGFAGILVTSHNNRILDNNVSDNPFGISLIGANHNLISNNSCHLGPGKGILLDHSSYNILERNTCWMNGDGIYLYHSFFNTISENSCFDNEMGIELYRSDHNTLIGNVLTSNSYYGLHPLSSHFNTITNNHLSLNKIKGIQLTDNTTNVLSGNDRDQDSVLDEEDAFVDDPAASVDDDADGYPDAWNPNMTGEDSCEDLDLDHFPEDPVASMDTDKDGYPDSWNDGVLIENSSTRLTLDEFPRDPDEWKDSDDDGYGDNEDDFPTVSYLHSYFRFFGTLFLIIGVSIGGQRQRRSMIIADCRHLLTECAQKQDEARFHKISFEIDGYKRSEEDFDHEEYSKARKGLRKERETLTELLNDHHLAVELIEFVEHSYEWAEENGFDHETKEFESAKKGLEEGEFKGSITFSREAYKEIREIKEKLEALELHMAHAEHEMSIARKSVSIRNIEPVFGSVRDLYKERELEKATSLLDDMMRDVKDLRRTAIPNVTLSYLKTREEGEWTWVLVKLKNKGMAHARNIRMTTREDEIKLKHDKIHRLASDELKETEIAVKLPEDHNGMITILTTSSDQTLEIPYEHEIEIQLDLDVDAKMRQETDDRENKQKSEELNELDEGSSDHEKNIARDHRKDAPEMENAENSPNDNEGGLAEGNSDNGD